MKLNYRLIVCVALVVAVAGACSKKYKQPDTVEPNVVNPFGGPPGSLTPGSQLNKLFKDLRSVPERQCVTAGVLQVVQFKKGTILTFYPNSFKDKTGKIITEGTVCLDVVEMYNPGSMIANRATTMADNGILQSGGQVDIKATKDGEEVFANTYDIAFRQAGPSSQIMYLYEGSTANSDSTVKWVIADTSKSGTIAEGTVYDTSEVTPPLPPPTFGYAYKFSSTKFRHMNCDQIRNVDTSLRTIVTAKFPNENYNSNNTSVDLILTEMNGLLELDYQELKKSFTVGEDHPLHRVPIGYNVILITITKKDNTYYYFEKPIVVAKDMEIDANPEAKSEEFIKARLNEL